MDGLLSWILHIDQYVNQWSPTIRNPRLTDIMLFFTSLGRFYPMVILSVILFVALIVKKKKDLIVPFLIAMPGGYALMSLLKYLIARPRPNNAMFHVSNYSFPSGHAMMSTIFFSFVLIAFIRDIKSTFLRTLFVITMVAFPILISFSRIYFNVHWLSDVIAGMVMGIIWVSLSLSIK